MEQDQEMSSKMATIEDLHNRLKMNIDNIQQLNTQVYYLTFCYEDIYLIEKINRLMIFPLYILDY